jgi:hypothetical protein
MVRAFRTFVALCAVAAATACTMKGTDTPPLAGPSELGLSLTLTATPDVLSQDGSDQATLVIQARDATGQPVRNLGLRVEIVLAGRPADYGTLSPGKVVSTGSDGRAVVVYTAPAAPLQTVDTGSNIITLAVTPSGTDYNNATTRTVNIRLVPPGVIVPTSGPRADFTFAPSVPRVLEIIQFDGSLSTTDQGATIDVYTWTFGDGDVKVINAPMTSTTHDFLKAGVYSVSLKVADSMGRTHTVTKAVTITP